MMNRFLASAAVGAIALASAGASSAATQNFFANLTSLSGSGVSGRADLQYDDVTQMLTVMIEASGLEPNQTHIQHIHGPLGGNATTPTLAQDTDGDGFIELAEGLQTYGQILLNLDDEAGNFPTAPGGTISFSHTYDLTSTPSLNGVPASALFPLTSREFVLHGRSLAAGQGSNGGEADGTAGYKLVLPVAAGEIRMAPIPLPAAGLLLMGGLGGLGGLAAWRRRRS